jgi:hypothetical protein
MAFHSPRSNTIATTPRVAPLLSASPPPSSGSLAASSPIVPPLNLSPRSAAAAGHAASQSPSPRQLDVSLRAALLDGSIPATTLVALQDVVLADTYSAWRDTLAQHSVQFNALLDAVAALERRRIAARQRNAAAAAAAAAAVVAVGATAPPPAVPSTTPSSESLPPSEPPSPLLVDTTPPPPPTSAAAAADAHHQQTLIAAVAARRGGAVNNSRGSPFMRGRRAGTGATRAPPSTSVSPLAHITQPLHKTDSYDTDVSMARRKLVDISDRDSTSSVLPQLPAIDDDDDSRDDDDDDDEAIPIDVKRDLDLSRESVLSDPLPRLPPT